MLRQSGLNYLTLAFTFEMLSQVQRGGTRGGNQGANSQANYNQSAMQGIPTGPLLA